MNDLETEFTAFFDAIHGRDLFPWQRMLAGQVVQGGWPDVIDLPTASGKTACIDIAVFALAKRAMGQCATAPRRIWFVVDRRIVVDEAMDRAETIATALRKAANNEGHRRLNQYALALLKLGGGRKDNKPLPLAVSRLRGGVPRDVSWSGNPAQPVVLTSTVDQIGSRLLFRGYGAGPSRRPMDAALVAHDSLVILDEAHCAKPFMQTVQAVQRLQQPPFAKQSVAMPLTLAIMSATPPTDVGGRKLTKFPKSQAERREALAHDALKERGNASKLARLLAVKKFKPAKDAPAIGPAVRDADDFVLAAAEQVALFVQAGRNRIAVMVNRVATAQLIQAQLSQTQADVRLMVGRMRPIDRDALVNELTPKLRSGSDIVLPTPLVLVTTQCLEVGADFSFDALVTECASLDALRQRFGRLDRLGKLGTTHAAILVREADLKPKKPDPVYGDALPATWDVLDRNATGNVIDMGISAVQKWLPDDLSKLVAPTRDAPVLLPGYVDRWSETNPPPAIDPDVSLFLHGMREPGERVVPEVRLVWRADLLPDQQVNWPDCVYAYPPLSAEMLTMPLHEFKRLIQGRPARADVSDVEGETEPADDRPDSVAPSPAMPFVIFRQSRAILSTDIAELRMNDVIVLPASSPLFNRLVHNSQPDVYELAHEIALGFLRIRLVPEVLRQWLTAEVVDEIATELAVDEPDENALWEQVQKHKESANLAGCWAELFKHQRPRLAEGGFDESVFVGKREKEAPIGWEPEDEDQRLADDGGGHLLVEHLRLVGAAAKYLTNPGHQMIEPALAKVVVRSAELHDIGKADPRMQDYLAGSYQIASDDRLLAKSRRVFIPVRERRLQDWSKLPKGFRHEVLSMQMVRQANSPADHDHRDLLLHLIASHHGHCRPFAPIVPDDTPPEAAFTLNGDAWLLAASDRIDGDSRCMSLDTADRFWRLTRRYGWWGLAYLELLVRSADHYVSSLETQS